MTKYQVTLIIMSWVVTILTMCQSTLATTVPFTEDFDTSASDWRDAAGAAALNHFTSGGPDGGAYAFGTFNFVGSNEGDTAVILRGQDEFGSSDGAFEGDWINDGVANFSAFLRHDAPVPLTFSMRFSGPGNWPGATAVNFAPVLSNTWTQISVDITATNSQFVSFEGTDFSTVFSNIGHMQIGVDVPLALAGVDSDYTFDVDKAMVVPEPMSLALLGMGALSLIHRRRA